jgi:hypothetical protein
LRAALILKSFIRQCGRLDSVLRRLMCDTCRQLICDASAR